MFELVEESLNNIALAIESFAKGRDVDPCRHGPDAGPCTAPFKLADPKMRFGEVEFLLQFHSSELEIVPMRGHNFRPDETADLAHIDLAGDGGGDEDGALFL